MGEDHRTESKIPARPGCRLWGSGTRGVSVPAFPGGIGPPRRAPLASSPSPRRPAAGTRAAASRRRGSPPPAHPVRPAARLPGPHGHLPAGPDREGDAARRDSAPVGGVPTGSADPLATARGDTCGLGPRVRPHGAVAAGPAPSRHGTGRHARVRLPAPGPVCRRAAAGPWPHTRPRPVAAHPVTARSRTPGAAARPGDARPHPGTTREPTAARSRTPGHGRPPRRPAPAPTPRHHARAGHRACDPRPPVRRPGAGAGGIRRRPRGAGSAQRPRSPRGGDPAPSRPGQRRLHSAPVAASPRTRPGRDPGHPFRVGTATPRPAWGGR